MSMFLAGVAIGVAPFIGGLAVWLLTMPTDSQSMDEEPVRLRESGLL